MTSLPANSLPEFDKRGLEPAAAGDGSVAFSTLDFRGRELSRAFLRENLPRPAIDVGGALHVVEPIIAAVRERGVDAVLEYGQKFDAVKPPSVRVPAEELVRASERLDPHVRQALELAIERVRAVAEFSVPAGTRVEVTDGGIVGERVIPVERAGVYVPGGRAVLPSSVVMNVVPAQAAGVSRIAVCSPPHADNGGYPHSTILAACAMLGVDEVYAAGGAQAIALLAYGSGGSQAVEAVDVITGPGNVYVAAAKRAVSGIVGIDSEAGPTEIAIIADSSARAHVVAADLMSQAEHDPLAAGVLITDCPEMIAAVRRELDYQVARTEHRERVREALSGPQSAAVLVDDIDAAIAVANGYGAEHVEIHTSADTSRDAHEVSARITNAGAIFIGENSPVSLGDYVAGSNHVLPTGGSARYSSGLGVHSFVRRVYTVSYSRQALADSREAGYTLAVAEGLPAHAAALAARFER